MIRIGLIGTNNTHGHQLAGFINGWNYDTPIPTRSKDHGLLPQFYDWAKVLRRLEEIGEIPATDARVTRLWSESPDTEGTLIAEACRIDELVDTPRAATQDVDAVLILTDDPDSHYEMAKAAFKSGLPTFIDKPLAPDVDTARRIADLAARCDVPWFSGSAFRFSAGLANFRDRLAVEIGTTKAVYVQCSGWMQHYGIHALEVMNVLVGHQVAEVHSLSLPDRNSALLALDNGVTTLLETMRVSLDPPGQAIAWGPRGSLHWECRDGHEAIFGLTSAFLNMIRTGVMPVPVEETLKLARLALQLNTLSNHPY